jgi:UDPglucose 6-dehydrogenase
MPWLQQVENATEAIEDADILIMATPWPEYQHLQLEKLYSMMKTPIIIDPLSLFSKQNPEQVGFKWVRLGV